MKERYAVDLDRVLPLLVSNSGRTFSGSFNIESSLYSFILSFASYIGCAINGTRLLIQSTNHGPSNRRRLDLSSRKMRETEQKKPSRNASLTAQKQRMTYIFYPAGQCKPETPTTPDKTTTTCDSDRHQKPLAGPTCQR
jgi:hypothetical protein